jgi:putative transposase
LAHAEIPFKLLKALGDSARRSLIEKSFRRLVKTARLGEFWRSLLRHYGGEEVKKLDESKIRYIIRARQAGERVSDIARNLSISKRRIEQVYAYYRKTKTPLSLSRAGRKSVPIKEDEIRIVLLAHQRYRVGALYLKRKIESDYGIHINHDRIQRVLRMNGLSSESPRRWIRRKWVRYERAYSNSLWHVDWYEVKDPRWKGMWLIVYEDDASRFIVGYGLFENATSPHAVEVLKQAIAKYGKPKSILSDRGIQFYAVEAEAKEKGLTEFELFLMRNHIRHVLGRVSHPQTNGKVEKLFDEIGRKVKWFSSIDECVGWYNTIKPHGALDLKTPIDAYYERMPQIDALMDPSILEKEVLA